MINAAMPSAIPRSRSHVEMILVARGESDPGGRGVATGVTGTVGLGDSITEPILYRPATNRFDAGYQRSTAGNHCGLSQSTMDTEGFKA